MTDIQTPAHTTGRRRRRLLIALSVFASLVVIGGLTGLVWWSLGRQGDAGTTGKPSIEAYRSAWESAMRKASVEATFPAAPVPLQRLESAGHHSFSATFTDAEMTALLNVYRYPLEGQSVSLDHVTIAFPSAGRAAMQGSAAVNGSSYSAALEANVTYTKGSIVALEPMQVSVEGFTLRGARREQAVDGILGYLNAMLNEAPGLTIVSAEVVKGGVKVEGIAPDRLINPSASERLEQKAASLYP